MPREKPEYVEFNLQTQIPKPVKEFIDSYLKFTRVKPQRFWELELLKMVDRLLTELEGSHIDYTTLAQRYGLDKLLLKLHPSPDGKLRKPPY